MLLQIHNTILVKYLFNKAMFYRQHLHLDTDIKYSLIGKKLNVLGLISIEHLLQFDKEHQLL